MGSGLALIGIDCACDPKNVGLAVGVIDGDGVVTIKVAQPGTTHEDNVELVVKRIRDTKRVLIALDAPLGWPKPMARALTRHKAGQPFKPTPHAMFRRATDNDISDRLHKRPLDVGANWIARTAHAALTMLSEIRGGSGKMIPLAWSPGRVNGVEAIEVYPAATLKAHGGLFQGYKKPEQIAERRRIVKRLRKQQKMLIPRAAVTTMGRNDDVLDAVVCVLAAADFVRGDAIPPTDAKLGLAQREGWIWAFDPDSGK